VCNDFATCCYPQGVLKNSTVFPKGNPLAKLEMDATIDEKLSQQRQPKSLERSQGRSKTQSLRSLIEAKHSGVDIRTYTDDTGVKHTVYLVTKPKMVTYFSYEYPPKELHEYYDEWDWKKAGNNSDDPSTPNGNMNGRRTPNPEYGGSKALRKRKHKTRKARK